MVDDDIRRRGDGPGVPAGSGSAASARRRCARSSATAPHADRPATSHADPPLTPRSTSGP